MATVTRTWTDNDSSNNTNYEQNYTFLLSDINSWVNGDNGIPDYATITSAILTLTATHNGTGIFGVTVGGRANIWFANDSSQIVGNVLIDSGLNNVLSNTTWSGTADITSFVTNGGVNAGQVSNGTATRLIVTKWLSTSVNVRWNITVSIAFTYEEHECSYSSWTTTKNATCTSTGTRSRTCTVCGETQTQTTAMKAHTEVAIPAVAATCTATGLTAGKKCSVCGTVTVAQTTVAKKAHTAVTDKAVSATCTTAGKTAGSHCSVCNTVITAQQTIAALGHDMGSYVQTVAPTYSAAGSERSDCSRCDHYTTRAIAALGFPVYINSTRCSGVYYVEAEKTIYYVISGTIPSGASIAFDSVDGIHFKVTNSVPTNGKLITGIYHNTTLMK